MSSLEMHTALCVVPWSEDRLIPGHRSQDPHADNGLSQSDSPSSSRRRQTLLTTKRPSHSGVWGSCWRHDTPGTVPPSEMSRLASTGPYEVLQSQRAVSAESRGRPNPTEVNLGG